MNNTAAINPTATVPYLSLVVAARYDDHGGNFMRRMQAFLNAFIEQCHRHRLQAEVIVVEWNPLPDRCGLAEALEWPAGDGSPWCQVRFIEVPPEIHARYEHGAKIPLYQMIAKNVGIQRARGEWILATNIDIFFNDELMRFLASRKLNPHKMYRIDRHDAGDGFPLWASVDEQLAYCESHVLRLSAREGTFSLNEHGHRTWGGPDIADANQLGLGSGWHSPEWFGKPASRPIRYFADGAEILIPAHAEAQTLVLWIDPGVNAVGPLRVGVAGAEGALLGEATFYRMMPMRVLLPASSAATQLTLQVHTEWKPAAGDMRKLTARAWSVTLGEPTDPPALEKVRVLSFADRAAIWARRRLPRVHRMTSPAYRFMTGRKVEEKPTRSAAEFQRSRSSKPPDFLHTNACGDFTLLHCDAWRNVRGYPEFDAYSMNIDSVLCWAAHYAGHREEMLNEPMRIYHMEHGAGSGWTPEGAQLLYERIKKAGLPWLEYSELMGWVECMHAWQRPLLFNGSDWGLAAEQLRETAPALGERYDAMRWCKDDPESPSRQREQQRERQA